MKFFGELSRIVMNNPEKILFAVVLAVFIFFLKIIKNAKSIETCFFCGMTHNLELSEKKLTEYTEDGRLIRLVCDNCKEKADKGGFKDAKRRI